MGRSWSRLNEQLRWGSNQNLSRPVRPDLFCLCGLFNNVPLLPPLLPTDSYSNSYDHEMWRPSSPNIFCFWEFYETENVVLFFSLWTTISNFLHDNFSLLHKNVHTLISMSIHVVHDHMSCVSFFLSHSSICSLSDVYALCKPNILWGPGVLECKGSAEAGRERLHYPHQRARVNSHNQCFPITHSSLPLPLSPSLSLTRSICFIGMNGSMILILAKKRVGTEQQKVEMNRKDQLVL